MDKETAMKFDTTTYFELSGVLVRFWKEHGITDKDLKIAYLKRMLKWYNQRGYVVLDKSKEKGNAEEN